MDWSRRGLVYAYGALGVVVLGLAVARIVGGSRGLGWAALALAAAIIIGALRFVVRDRRRGHPPSWSPVLFGGFLACAALRRIAPEDWDPSLLSLELGFVIALGVAFWREDRRQHARLRGLRK